MAAPTPDVRITGRPPIDKYTPHDSYNTYRIERFGDAGGATQARFYVWGGIQIVSVNDSSIDNWNIGIRPNWCITITVSWGNYSGRIKGDLTGDKHARGGFEAWNFDGSQKTLSIPNPVWYYGGDFNLQYKEADDYELWRGVSDQTQNVIYYANPGETVKLWGETGSYSGGSMGSSTLTPLVLKLPNAPIAYFHWNDPRDSSTTDYHGDSGTSTDAAVVYSRARAWESTNYTFPADPSIAQWRFLGWYDQAVGGNKITTLTAQIQPNHLYAQWEMIGHSVVYDKNDTNATGDMPDGIKPYGSNYVIESCAFLLNDNTFQFWSGQRGDPPDPSTTQRYDPEDEYTYDEKLTLKAVWKRNHHAPRSDGLPVVKRYDWVEDPDNAGQYIAVEKDDGEYIHVEGSFIYDSLYTDEVHIRVKYYELNSWVQVGSDIVIDNLTTGTTEKTASFSWTLPMVGSGSTPPFSSASSYRILIEFIDYVSSPDISMSSSVETFLSSAFFYMDINHSTKVMAIGAGAGDLANAWDDSEAHRIDTTHTDGTLNVHTNTLFSNNVYFHEGSQLMLGGLEGNSGDVLVSGGTGAAPVWRSPINIKFDLIYDHTGSWWYSSAIGGGVPGDQYYNNGELIDGYSILDYKFLLLYFKAGNTTDLSNARGSVIVPVSGIHQWHSWDTVNNYCVIDEGQNCFDWVYSYPAADPSWFIDVAFGFFNDHHIYAKKRTTTNQNLHTWNLEQIWGIGFDPWSQGSAPLGYTRFTGPLSYTPSASQSVNIDTDGTYLDDDITVAQIPYAEVDNEDGGRTATIAS